LREGLPKRELSDKERRRREERLRKEMETHFKKWLEEDAAFILMPEEKDAFKHLNTDEEREQFVEQFWLRRDPTPDTLENEYKEEHYRRIAYSNERFASGLPGWRTDRGRIYIMHGPPAEIESYPGGGSYNRRPEEGGGYTSVYPFERWRYRYLENVGTDIEIEFVDTTGTGEFRMTMDPSEKDALTFIPGAGLSQGEQVGTSRKLDRFTRSDGTHLPGDARQTARTSQFERLRLFTAVQKAPPVKFKDLEELVRTRISFNLLPFDVRTDYVRVTDSSILVPVTIGIQKKDMTFVMDDGIHIATVNVFGRITTLTGRIVQTFEDVISLSVPPSLFATAVKHPAVYQKAIPLRPGLYKLNVVLKDLNSGNVGTLETRLAVPRFEEQQLAHSSLIVADLLERVPTKTVGTGQFVLGETKVRPVISKDLTSADRMGIYLQVYNLAVDETSHKPNATIDYSIVNGDGTVFHHSETTGELERAGRQITLEKLLPLGTFKPGEYTLNIKITDHLSEQTIEPSARFRIRKQ
jgi:GWxTD domain-containing protein